MMCWEWWGSTLMTPYKKPDRPYQPFGQWNRLFPRVFVKNHLLPAHYSGLDWSGSIVLTNGEGFSRSVLTNGKRPQSASVTRSISWCCVEFQPLSFSASGLLHVLSCHLYYWLYYYLLIQYQDITISRLFTLSHKTTSGFIITPNFANLSRKFTKPLAFVKLEPLAALVLNFTRL